MREILTSPRIEDIKRKRRNRRRRMFVMLVVLFVSLIGALAYFSSYNNVTINNIRVEGTQIINSSEVESRVLGKLSGRYFYLFARSNFLIYPKKQIYNDLLKSFPRIETLSVARDGFNTLEINITERSGAYLYCGATVPEVQSEVGENCYFVNNDGYIFDKAPYFSGNVYFKYYTALPTDSNPLTQYIVSTDRFHLLARFIDGITNLGFNPINLVIDQNGLHSLYLANPSGSTSPKVIFNQEDELSAVLDNLSISMNNPEFAQEINSKYDTLLYIDLRFKNKVLYKFQD